MAKGKYQRWLLPESLILLEGWAREGLTDEQIAKRMRISPGTLYDWEKKYPEISEALKKGKEVIDYEVERALLQRALGYDAQDTKVELGPDGSKTVQTLRHIPGDTTAQIFWLKNRRPDKWRDRREAAEFNEQEQADVVSAFLKAVRPVPADLEALYAEEK